MKRLIGLIVFLLSLNALGAQSKVIHVEGGLSEQKSWMQHTSSAELNLKKLSSLLSLSPHGKKLLELAKNKAQESGLGLLDVIKPGEGSLTDTTLVRKFSADSPDNITYETRSVVYINQHLSWEDALLDLAHELAHFIYREGFNPYDPSFNARDFIMSTIEGRGGEVEAFLTECQVSRELFPTKNNPESNCKKIESFDGTLSFSKAVELFYHVGSYYESLKEKLSEKKIQSSFSHLRPKRINFISSAYGVPYPVAALMEYEFVMEKVCENDKKRLAFMQQGPQRRPAAASSKKREEFLASYSARCAQR